MTIKGHYDAQAGLAPTESASQDEVKDALKTLGEGLSTAIGAVGAAFRDPEVTSEVKETAASFFGAVGVSFSEIGAGIGAHQGAGDTVDGSDTDEATQPDTAASDLTEDE